MTATPYPRRPAPRRSIPPWLTLAGAVLILTLAALVSAQTLHAVGRVERIEGPAAEIGLASDPELLRLEQAGQLTLGHLLDRDLAPAWVWTLVAHLEAAGGRPRTFTLAQLTRDVPRGEADLEAARPGMQVVEATLPMAPPEVAQSIRASLEAFADAERTLADMRRLLGFLETRPHLSWEPLRPDVLIIAGETIRTGTGTSVRVRYDTGAVVRVEAESTLTIGGRPTRATSRGDFLGRLLRGIADFYAPTSPAGYEVETHRVVVGIRGTEFRLAHADGATSVAVTNGLVDVTDLESGAVVTLRAGDAWSSAGAPSLAGGPTPIAPPSDVAAVVPPGWHLVDTGVVCFALPRTWTDDTANARRGADGEVLAAWSAPFATGLMPAAVFVSLVTPSELASELADIASDPDFTLRHEYGAPFAGAPATWREYGVADEGRLTMVATAPRPDGRVLVTIVAARFDAAPGTESDVQAILGSFAPCGGQAPSAALPQPVQPPTPVQPPAVVQPPTPQTPAQAIRLGCADAAEGGALGSLAIGDTALVSCPSGCTADHAVWGTDVYSDDSSVCRAGIHAGAIDAASGGSFAILVRGGRDRYAGTTRNGVTTRDWGSWHRSFVVDAGAVPPGAAPVAPPPGAAPVAPPPGAAPVAPPPSAAPVAPPPLPVEVGRTPDVVIDLPTQRGELSATRTSETHTITIDRAGDLRIAVQASGDLAFHAYLFDTNGSTSLHLQNTGYESQRTVERAGLAPGTYHLRIDRTRGQGAYTIQSTLTAITTPDDREPNDTLAQAQPLALGATTGRLGYGNAERGTDTADWYAIRTDHDGDLAIRIQADDRLSIHAYLIDTNGSTSLHLQNTGYESQRTVERAGLAPGTYYLRIDRTRGHGGYTIHSTLTPETTPDDQEPNDTREQARILAVGTTTTGRLGYGNAERGTDTADWYTLRTDQACDLTADVRATPALSIHLYLLDERGGSVAVQNTGYESHRTIERAGLAAGTYYLRIDRTRGHGGYTLTTRCAPSSR